MDWTVVTSVIVGIFLFNAIMLGLKGITAMFIGLVMRRKEVGEIDTTRPRGNFLG